MDRHRTKLLYCSISRLILHCDSTDLEVYGPVILQWENTKVTRKGEIQDLGTYLIADVLSEMKTMNILFR